MSLRDRWPVCAARQASRDVRKPKCTQAAAMNHYFPRHLHRMQPVFPRDDADSARFRETGDCWRQPTKNIPSTLLTSLVNYDTLLYRHCRQRLIDAACQTLPGTIQNMEISHGIAMHTSGKPATTAKRPPTAPGEELSRRAGNRGARCARGGQDDHGRSRGGGRQPHHALRLDALPHLRLPGQPQPPPPRDAAGRRPLPWKRSRPKPRSASRRPSPRETSRWPWKSSRK